MSFVFGDASTHHLSNVDSRLVDIAVRALSYGVMDFSVIEGYRPVSEQLTLYRKGLSQRDGLNTKSQHNYLPSRAIDILPYPRVVNGINVWKDKQRFSVLAGLMHAAAAEQGLKLIWGGDWDGDGNNADSAFLDMAHFELAD